MMSMSTDNVVILQRKTCSPPMRTRSSLELMLDRIQQRDADQAAAAQDEPPALPSRPISKARTPPGRRKAVTLPFNSQEVESNGGGNEERRKPRMIKSMRTKGRTCLQESTEECGFPDNGYSAPNKIGTMNGAAESALLEGVILVQKCFRRHKARCHYHELKRAIITLQSFVRGENERRNCEVLVKKPKRDHGDCVQVPCSEVAVLQMRVLRAEAELAVKNDENAALQLRLEQYDRKWQQYEAKMKSMEKSWQDQLASIQARLAARNGSRACEMPDIPQINGRVCTIKHIIEQHERGVDDDGSNSCEPSGFERSEPGKELRELNMRFNSWNKNYKTRLRETKTKLARLDVHARVKKCHKWW